MIAEAFLICALAPAPMAMTSHPFSHQGVLTANHSVIQAAEFITRRKRDVAKPILLLGGEPSLVSILRATGFRAFGGLTDDRPGVTRWHSVTNSDALSFDSRSFHVVATLQTNPVNETGYDALKEAVRVTMPGGFLMFEEDEYPDWKIMLHFWNWERLPLAFNGLAIYRRPFSENHLSWFYKNSMRKMGKTVLPFRQRFAMREILAAA